MLPATRNRGVAPRPLPPRAVKSARSRLRSGLRPPSWTPPGGERGAAGHDSPLRLPRPPQGQHPRLSRAPAPSQGTEAEPPTAGWSQYQTDDAGPLKEIYSPARKDGGKRTREANARSYGNRADYRETFKGPPKDKKGLPNGREAEPLQG